MTKLDGINGAHRDGAGDSEALVEWLLIQSPFRVRIHIVRTSWYADCAYRGGI